MKKILIDMDDVICEGGFLRLVNQFMNTNYTKEDIPTYHIQDLVPEEKRKEWNEYFKKYNLYNYVEFLPDAYEVIEKLNRQYEIYILTAYVLRDLPEFSGKFLHYKYDWLYQNLPFIHPDNYIFTTNKEVINGDIRIDDKLSNLDGPAQTKLLFASYHNQNHTKEELEQKNVIRVNSWKEIEKILIF